MPGESLPAPEFSPGYKQSVASSSVRISVHLVPGQLGKGIFIWIKRHVGTSKIFMYAERDWEFVSFSAVFPSEEAAQGAAVGTELQ